MAAGAEHAVPVQYTVVRWHVVPVGHGAAPSVSHRWAHLPLVMHTSPVAQAVLPPHVLVEHASPTEKSAATQSRLMGGTLSRLMGARPALDQARQRPKCGRGSERVVVGV